MRSAAGRLRILTVTAVVVAGLGAGCARQTATDDALVAAIQYGEVEEAARLVEEGADVDARTREERTTVLMLASRHDFSGETTELLLRHGADIEAEDELGYGALDDAATEGNVAAARALVAVDPPAELVVRACAAARASQIIDTATRDELETLLCP